METTLDVLNAVQQCPIWTGDDVNEIGEDCAGCARVDPDRAAACRHVFEWGEIEITPDLMAIIPDDFHPQGKGQIERQNRDAQILATLHLTEE